MLLLHHRVIHVTILYQSEERQPETKWLTCIFRNNMMALPNLEPVVLDLRSNLHLAGHFALNSPKEKRLSIAYFMTCWLSLLFHYNNWILTALLKLKVKHMWVIYVLVNKCTQHPSAWWVLCCPSSLLTGWFGHLQPYVTRTLWHVICDTLHFITILDFFSFQIITAVN